MCRVPPPPSSSIWNGHTTTTSEGVTMPAKLGLISELRYSTSMSAMGVHASFMSAKAPRRNMWMTRISVAENSRPSILVCRPTPPKKLSTMVNTSFGSSTNSAVPRSGLILQRLRLMGSASECVYSLNFFMETWPTASSTDLRSRPYRLTRNWRAKRSLTISSVGMRPRTMRISRLKSYCRASPGAASGSVLTAPASTPLSNASISSWLSTSWPLIVYLLHDERSEIQRLELARVAAHLRDDGLHAVEASLAQRFLAFESGDGGVALVAEDQQQVVAYARIVALDQRFDRRVARHHVDGDLQEAHHGFGFEIDDEGRIERDVARREFFLDLRLAIGLAAQELPGAKTAAAEHQHRHQADDQALPGLATFGDFAFGLVRLFFVRHESSFARALRLQRLCNARAMGEA